MTMRQHDSDDRDLLAALRRVAEGTLVPPVDPAREAALLQAFDAAQRQPRRTTAAYWWMATLATAAAVLIALSVAPLRERRTALPVPAAVDAAGAPRELPGEFIPWPGARDLPPLESGQLVRVDLPVSMLPSLGIVPPASRVRAVKADVVVGQDGLARAVRLVGD